VTYHVFTAEPSINNNNINNCLIIINVDNLHHNKLTDTRALHSDSCGRYDLCNIINIATNALVLGDG